VTNMSNYWLSTAGRTRHHAQACLTGRQGAFALVILLLEDSAIG
jgi:hypothetical protein